jgi:thioredoxin 1
VVDFNATWCAPCKKLAPILEQVEKDYAGKVKVVKIDVDANRSLAAAKHIDGIPFLEIYKNGKLTMQHEGLTTYEDLVKLLPL